MRAVGVTLIFLAAIVLLVALHMDTSVPTETGGRVYNIGLMRQQEIRILLAVGLFIGGIILFAFGGKKTSLRPQSIEDGDHKKCPYCAESIKAEAIKCRFCGADLPRQSVIESRMQLVKEQLLNQNPSAQGPMSEDDLIEFVHKHYTQGELLQCRYFVQKLLQEHPQSLYADFATTRLSEIDKKLGIEQSKTKVCPACQKQIPSTALTCKFCQAVL